ncbi:MAG: DUF3326 domain-containing protein [Candidatus Gastranaerophilales bacterium]|nr:DUF3326 domain-containing protein [Candidatus Gastranaerophilales bacterium]
MDNNFAAFIVPAGIGASIGGFAGDAGIYARKLSHDIKLIVNPNVVNAACFSAINDSMLYVEGFALNRFFKGDIALRKSTNKIGVIFDKAIPQGVLNVHINTLNAMKMVYGVEGIEFEVTSQAACVNFEISSSNISTGSVDNLDTLIEAGHKLVKKGCSALAVVCRFDETPDDGYENGQGVDIVGGVEAIISHALSRKFNLPCAHAPAFEDMTISTGIVSPKAAAEYITPTFLPCIILGLWHAPQLIDIKKASCGDIVIEDLKALVMPYNALGSTPVFKSLEKNIPVLAVKENSTVLSVDKNKLELADIVELEKYADVAQYLS